MVAEPVWTLTTNGGFTEPLDLVGSGRPQFGEAVTRDEDRPKQEWTLGPGERATHPPSVSPAPFCGKAVDVTGGDAGGALEGTGLAADPTAPAEHGDRDDDDDDDQVDSDQHQQADNHGPLLHSAAVAARLVHLTIL